MPPSIETDALNGVLEPFISRLERVGGLKRSQAVAARTMALQEKVVGRGSYLPENDGSTIIMAEGIALLCRDTTRGLRQVTQLLLPGDWSGNGVAPAGHLRLRYAAATTCRVAIVSRSDLARFFAAPETMMAAWRIDATDAVRTANIVAHIGRRNAARRIVYILCEIYEELKARGLASEDECQLPLRQSHLADMTGLTAVHVNRVLQKLDTGNIVTFKNHRLVISDWEAAYSIAGRNQRSADAGGPRRNLDTRPHRFKS